MTDLEKLVKEHGIAACVIGVGRETLVKDSVRPEPWECFTWLASLHYDGRFVTVPEYHTGIGCVKETKRADGKHLGNVAVTPSAADILYSMLMSMDSIDESFEAWCSNFGYDTDSRRAENMYHACKGEAEKVIKLLGRELADILRSVEH